MTTCAAVTAFFATFSAATITAGSSVALLTAASTAAARSSAAFCTSRIETESISAVLGEGAGDGDLPCARAVEAVAVHIEAITIPAASAKRKDCFIDRKSVV